MEKTPHLSLRWLLLPVLFLFLAACDLLRPSVPAGDLLAPDPPQLAGAAGETAVVTDVVDGDTIRVEIDGREVRVRYVGIDAPERDEACYDDAAAANAALVEGQTVRLVRDVSDTDRFDRLLRYVYVDEMLVNAELVAGGWAEARRYPPDDELHDYLEGLETLAAGQERGCHPAGVFAR